MNYEISSDVCERDLDFLMLEELECNTPFFDWFSERVGGLPGIPRTLAAARRSVSTWKGETDLLLIEGLPDGRRRAIMIENKIAANFTPDQAKRYRERGRDGIQTGEWDEFVTVLVAPAKRLDEKSRSDFDHSVEYEEISEVICGPRADFKKRVLHAACGKAREPWVQTIDKDLTAWFVAARLCASEKFPELPLPVEGKGRAPTSTWLSFYVRAFPQSRVIVEIKPASGVVDLRVYGAPFQRFSAVLAPHRSPEAMFVEAATGKSCSLRVQLQPLNVRAPFDGQEERLASMLAVASRFLTIATACAPSLRHLIGYQRGDEKVA